jgi:hypothetical protein
MTMVRGPHLAPSCGAMTLRSAAPSPISTVLSALLLAACSDDPGPATAAPVDGGVAETAAAPLVPMTVWVYGEPQFVDVAPQPLAGATVIFDAPGGTRVEKVTEADGHVTFEADFTLGSANVTVVAANHAALSMVGATPDALKLAPPALGRPAGDLVLVPPLQVPSMVTLSGSFTNKLDPANVVVLTTTGSFDQRETPTDFYSLVVPKDHAFTIVGHEGKPGAAQPRNILNGDVRMFRIDQAAIAQDTKLDIDLSIGNLTAPKVHWKIETPGGDTGPLGVTTRGIANVVSTSSNVNLGPCIASTVTPTGFDVELQVAQTDMGGETIVSRTIVLLADGAQSMAQEVGIAPEGTVFKDFLTPPPITFERQRVTTPISLEGFPENASPVVQLFGRQGLAWVIVTPYRAPHGSTLQLPAVPPKYELPDNLGGRLLAFGHDGVERPGGQVVPRHVGVSREFSLAVK